MAVSMRHSEQKIGAGEYKVIALGQIEASRKATCTCMILARDCEKNIAGCLRSAISSGAFQEVLVILDTRTKDRTPAIVRRFARRFPIRILWYVWDDPPDFAAARNAGIEQVKTAYAFWLDCDERIKDPAALRKMLTDPRGRAFSFWIVSPMGAGKSFDMYQPRLFPVASGARFECAIFERLDWSLKRRHVPIVNTTYKVIQHGGYSDAKLLRRKNRRNLRSLQKWLSRHAVRDYRWKHLNQQYQKLRFLEGIL